MINHGSAVLLRNSSNDSSSDHNCSYFVSEKEEVVDEKRNYEKRCLEEVRENGRLSKNKITVFL